MQRSWGVRRTAHLGQIAHGSGAVRSPGAGSLIDGLHADLDEEQPARLRSAATRRSRAEPVYATWSSPAIPSDRWKLQKNSAVPEPGNFTVTSWDCPGWMFTFTPSDS